MVASSSGEGQHRRESGDAVALQTSARSPPCCCQERPGRRHKIGAEPKQKLVSWINTVVSYSQPLRAARRREVERTADQDAHRRGLVARRSSQRRAASLQAGNPDRPQPHARRPPAECRPRGLRSYGARGAGRSAPTAAGARGIFRVSMRSHVERRAAVLAHSAAWRASRCRNLVWPPSSTQLAGRREGFDHGTA